MNHMGQEITQVALTLAGIALVALLVGHADDTVKIIKGAGETYGGLLNIVTLQSGFTNAFSS